jgi:hypothetical protein
MDFLNDAAMNASTPEFSAITGAALEGIAGSVH